MREWIGIQDRLPVDLDMVDVKLSDGRVVPSVEFAGGRFWKVRVGNGGHAYDVAEWRPIHKKEEPADGRAESKNR